MSALLDAVLGFEDRLIGLDSLLEAFDGVAGDAPPAWLMVMQSHVKGLNEAFESISILSRGIGGVAPDIAKRNGIEGVD